MFDRTGGRMAAILVVLILAGGGSLRADLVAHFPFDGDTLDASGNGNDGTFVGGDPVYVDGYDGTPGGALSFDGMDDRVDVAQTFALPLTDNPSLTVAMWVKGMPQSDKRVFSEGYSMNNSPLYNIGTDNTGATGALDIFIRRDAGQGTAVNHFKTGRPAFDGEWHHIAVVDDDGTVTIYIDGVQEGGGFTYTREPLTTDRTTIGAILRANPCCWFTGAIDDVRLYNHALTAEEVQALVPEPEGCPAEGDTTCGMIAVTPPSEDGMGEGGGVPAASGPPGEYTLEVTDAADGSGDAIWYTFVGENELGDSFRIGPQMSNTATVTLVEGTWTVTCFVDDDIRCRDPEGTCSVQITVISEEPRLLVHLPFDGSLDDATGNGNNASMVGDPVPFTSGYDCVYPGALEFDGGDDIVQVQPADGLPVYNSPTYSIAMWVKGVATPAMRDRRVYSESNASGNNSPLFNIGTDSANPPTGVVDIFIRGDAGQTLVSHVKSAGTAFDGTWHHIVWTDRNGEAALYIDGVKDPTDFSYAKEPITFDTVTVGGILRANGVCCVFPGSIDDVRVYNYILSEEEIQALAATPPDCTQQIAGDCNQDGERGVSDVICYVRALFPGFFLLDRTPVAAPCEGDLSSEGNVAVLDLDGNGSVGVGDAVRLADFLFRGGPPPVRGLDCIDVPPAAGCRQSAACP